MKANTVILYQLVCQANGVRSPAMSATYEQAVYDISLLLKDEERDDHLVLLICDDVSQIERSRVAGENGMSVFSQVPMMTVRHFIEVVKSTTWEQENVA